jgi:hypothetical protein
LFPTKSNLYFANLFPTAFHEPNIPCSKPHVHFLFPISFQRIHPCLRSCVTLHKYLI